ncbi:MAG: 3-oxoacyl-[acyl-carrier-protein] reductase [Bacteroidales bacterium]|nr:3-oxoacyl-[acyl-carrier-protein] reductase [Candidatus Colimorpha onthohippi]
MLKDKTAIITGGTRGIGRAIALKFASQGCQIAFTGRSRNSNMEQVEVELSQLGVKAIGYAADAADYNQSQELIKKVLADFGHIDILVNNAGITADSALKRMTEDQWDTVINTNLKSVFCMTKAVQPAMWRQGSGSIINISSVVGIAGNYNQSNYAASKAGIIGYTYSAAKELGARNIRVNAVAPGFILTEMTSDIPDEMKAYWQTRIPLRRPGTTDDVANACLYLASDMSTYISGTTLEVCGGMKDA